MVCTNKPIFLEYIEFHNKYTKLYGDKTIILMQVGGFYEIYCRHNEKDNLGPKPDNLISILNIIFSTKNKGTLNYHNMAGWPTHSNDKYIDILLNNNYTVVIIDQFDNEMGGNAKKDRKVTDILSPTTTITNVADYKSKFLMSIYFYKFKNRKTKKYQLNFSLSVIDLSIGKSFLYEDVNKDEKLLFDNIYRVILKFNPEEIIVFGDDIDITLIKNNINFNEKLLHNRINDYNKDILNVNYQTELLKRVYKNIGMLTPIEYIGLERNPDLLISFINLIEFAYSHNEKIIENLYKPEIIENNTQLVLGFNLVKKLDVISDDNSKYSCLLNILNNSSTNIGKRYFKNRLLNPYNSTDKITDSYENNSLMLLKSEDGKYIYEILRNKIKNICDIERLIKRMFLFKLQPQEFINIFNSLKIFEEIIKDINKFVEIDTNFNKFNKLNYSRDIFNLIKFISNNLDLDNINNYNFNNIDGHIFKKGVFKEIDELQDELDNNINSFKEKANELNNIDKDFNGFFKVDNNDNFGYFLYITNNRFNIFKRNSEYKDLDKITTKKVSASSSTLRLWFPEFSKINQSIEKLKTQILDKCMETYKKFCEDLFNNYETLLNIIVHDIEVIDYATTNAYNSVLYKYCRPTIKDNDSKSYLNLKQVRHPIIEIINEEIKYIANDIKLGHDQDGILLYGMNSAGKSSLMKSIGLSVIMAQAGMFVPCKKMEYYPYNKLYSRIPGGDNIFKGQSTFVGEISEIRNILKCADDKTLIIGDELCSGTETKSAIAIVSAGILDLIKKESSFIFATHLHELADMDRIKEIEKLSIKHLSVKYNNSKNILVFDRKLKDGPGDSIYGLEVCRSLDLDSDFLKLANEIRQEVLGIEKLLNFKKSKYNANLIVDKCNICKSEDATETHHIHFQKDADDNGFIEHYHKNKKFNLVGLCEKCHDRIHNGELEIGQATMTSNGIMYG